MAPSVRAAVLVKPKTLEAREFARPAIGPDDALLRIEACGICGSDYEQYEGAQPQHEDYTPYPVIPGHEPLGVIEEIGDRARARWGVAAGDRVAIAVRKGRIVVAGLKGLRPAHDVPVDDVIYKELTIRGVLSMPVDETFRAIDLIESGRYPFDKMHTLSFPLEQAEDAIHALAGHVPGVNPIHLAIVPGAPRVSLPR